MNAELILPVGIVLVLAVMFIGAYFQIKQNKKGEKKEKEGLKILPKQITNFNIDKAWKEASMVTLIAGLYQTIVFASLMNRISDKALFSFIAVIATGILFIILSFFIKKHHKIALALAILILLMWIMESVYILVITKNLIVLIGIFVKLIILFFIIQPTDWYKKQLDEYQRLLSK